MSRYLIGLFIWAGMVAVVMLWAATTQGIPEDRPPSLPAYGNVVHYEPAVTAEFAHFGAARVAKCHATDKKIICD
jgi:hypothetical protein